MDEPSAPPLELTEALIHEVRDALADGNQLLAAAVARPLHAADLADLLQQLEGHDRSALIDALGPDFDPDTLAYLDEFVRDQVIEALGPEAAGRALAQLETDDAVEILAELDDAEQKAILDSLPLPERAVIEQGLAYPEWSAGRLMQREVVAVPEYWTVGQTLTYLRAHPDLPDDFYDIFLVDPRFKVVGDVPLSRVLRSERAVPLVELKYKELRTFAGRGRPGGGGARLSPLRPGLRTGGRRRRPAAGRDHHRRRGRRDRGGGRGEHPQAGRRQRGRYLSSPRCRPASSACPGWG